MAEEVMSQTYWQQLNLASEPFVQGEQGDFYPILQWQENIELFEHCMFYSNVLLAVTGEIDSGKTSLIHKFQSYSAERLACSQINAHARVEADELLQVIASAFHISLDALSTYNRQQAYDELLEHLEQRDTHSVLIIDNAHRLPEALLDLLLQLTNRQTPDKNGLRFILVGEPELEILLSKRAKSYQCEQLLQHVRVEALTPEATAQYIDHCLNKVGAEGRKLLSKADKEQIYKLSEGYIGRINQVAKQALIKLSDGATTQGFSWKSQQYRFVGASTLAIVAIAFALILSHSAQDESLIQSPETPLVSQQAPPFVEQLLQQRRQALSQSKMVNPQVVLAANTIEQTVNNANDASTNILGPSPAVAAKQDFIAANLRQDKRPAQNPVIAKPSQTEIIHHGGHIAAKFVKHPVIKRALAPASVKKHQRLVRHEQNVPMNNTIEPSTDESSETKAAPLVVLDKVIVIPELKLTTETAQKPRPVVPVAKEPNITKPKTHKARVKPRKITQQQPVKRKALTINKKGFAIQLLATSQLEPLKLFIDTHRIKQKAHIVTTRRNNKSWYVLLYGQYASHAQAQRALRTLPTGLKRSKPWVRSYASVSQR